MTLSYLIGRRNVHNSPWTDERVALLVRLWAAGYSASQIAGQIRDHHISRCGVIGKAHRLNLPARKARQAARRNSVPKPPAPRSQPVPPPPPPGAPAMRWLRLIDLKPSSCRFPVGDVGFFFCAADAESGHVYCTFHQRMARVRK